MHHSPLPARRAVETLRMNVIDCGTGSMRPLILICSSVFLVLTSPGAAQQKPAVEAPVATILGYHEVDDAPMHSTIPRLQKSADLETEQRLYTITTAQFEQQLDYLDRNGYTVIPLERLVGYLKGRVKALPKKAVVITIDDGWLCAYTNALPILRKRNLPFTLFIYPDIIGQGSHAMTWPQVLLTSRQSGVEIGSHSYSHSFMSGRFNPRALAGNYEAFLRRELLDSRKTIEKNIGRRVEHFAYPYGDWDDTVAKATIKHGYAAALTVKPGIILRTSNPAALERFLVLNVTTLDDFKKFLP